MREKLDKLSWGAYLWTAVFDSGQESEDECSADGDKPLQMNRLFWVGLAGKMLR
jgi:hypothetical protein